jgi:hypothetical protein
VPCLPWLFVCWNSLPLHVWLLGMFKLCFNGRALDRFMPCTCLHVVSLTLCVAGLLLLRRRWRSSCIGGTWTGSLGLHGGWLGPFRAST